MTESLRQVKLLTFQSEIEHVVVSSKTESMESVFKRYRALEL